MNSYTEDQKAEIREAVMKVVGENYATNRVMAELNKPERRLRADCPVVDSDGHVWQTAGSAKAHAPQEAHPLIPLIPADKVIEWAKEWEDGPLGLAPLFMEEKIDAYTTDGEE